MTLTEKFIQKLESDLSTKSLLEFFANLTKDEKNSLKPTLAAYAERKRNDSPTRYVKASLCAMQCFNYKAFMEMFYRIDDSYFIDKYYVNFKPTWLENYINNHAWFMRNVPYSSLIELMENGIAIQDELLMDLGVYANNLEQVENYPIFFEKHLWWGFSDVRDMYESHWNNNLHIFMDTNKIDRQRVLSETLLATNRGFFQHSIRWFLDFFKSLNPNENELLFLQKELFIALHGTYSKTQNDCLGYIKTIASHADFQVESFIDNSAFLFGSDVKSVLTKTVAVFETIAKAHAENIPQLVEAIMQGFMMRDEKIQLRIAKFIKKYATPTDEINATLESYQDDLFSSVKSMLAPFLPTDLPAQNTQDNQSVNEQADILPNEISEISIRKKHIRDDNKLDIPTEFDDQIFFISHAFAHHEPYHFDVFLAVLSDLIAQITEDNFEKLAPVMKSAERCLTLSTINVGRIEHLMAYTFLDCINQLFSTFPNKKLQRKYKSVGNALAKRYMQFKEISKDTPLQTFSENNSSAPIPIVHLLAHSKDIGLHKQSVSILSTPTNLPCFVDITCFVSRLAEYNKNDISIDEIDFQVALLRLCWDNNTKMDMADIDSEYQQLLTYLTTDAKLHLNKCKSLSLWLTAIYRKGNQNELVNFLMHFDIQDLNYLAKSFAWEVKNYSDEYQREYVFQFIPFGTLNEYKEDYPNLIFNNFWYTPKNYDGNINYYFYDIDYVPLLQLTPFKQSLILRSIFNPHYEHAKSIIALWMHTWQSNVNDIMYLYVANLMIEDKQSAQIGSEFWLEMTNRNNIDHDRLGEMLGRLEHENFQPLKRFTDLLSKQLMGVSNQHNHALVVLTSYMITHMNDEPIKGTKKLLELYLELLTITKTALPDLVNEKLTIWAETKSLKAIIKKLNNL